MQLFALFTFLTHDPAVDVCCLQNATRTLVPLLQLLLTLMMMGTRLPVCIYVIFYYLLAIVLST